MRTWFEIAIYGTTILGITAALCGTNPKQWMMAITNYAIFALLFAGFRK